MKEIQKSIGKLQDKIVKMENEKEDWEDKDYQQALDHYWEEKGMNIKDLREENKEFTEKMKHYNLDIKKQN